MASQPVQFRGDESEETSAGSQGLVRKLRQESPQELPEPSQGLASGRLGGGPTVHIPWRGLGCVWGRVDGDIPASLPLCNHGQ